MRYLKLTSKAVTVEVSKRELRTLVDALERASRAAEVDSFWARQHRKPELASLKAEQERYDRLLLAMEAAMENAPE